MLGIYLGSWWHVPISNSFLWGTLVYIDGITREYDIYECLEASLGFLHEVFLLRK